MADQAQVAPQQQEEAVVTLKLKVSAVNAIIAGLDELPHKFSRGVIDEVSTQARQQLQPAAEPAPAPLEGVVV
jgi:hypothetical protein